MYQCILAKCVSAALWEWWLLPFWCIHDNWCPEKFRSRAGLHKLSSKVKYCPCATSWLGWEYCLVLWTWCHFFAMALFIVNGSSPSEEEVGQVRSVWSSHICLRCKEGNVGRAAQKVAENDKNPCSFCQHLFVTEAVLPQCCCAECSWRYSGCSPVSLHFLYPKETSG